MYITIIHSGGSRGGGANWPLSPPPPPPPPPPIFLLFHPGGRSGSRTVPLPQKKCVEAPPRWATFSDLARVSQHLDSRPSLFTNPGSATDSIVYCIIMHFWFILKTSCTTFMLHNIFLSICVYIYFEKCRNIIKSSNQIQIKFKFIMTEF